MTNQKPSVSLVGHDGNAFAVIGRTMKALRRAGIDPSEYAEKASNASDYDHVLQITMEYVNVS